jgi:hypothetical protein
MTPSDAAAQWRAAAGRLLETSRHLAELPDDASVELLGQQLAGRNQAAAQIALLDPCDCPPDALQTIEQARELGARCGIRIQIAKQVAREELSECRCLDRWLRGLQAPAEGRPRTLGVG